MRSRNELIVDTLKEANKPLRRSELHKKLEDTGLRIDYNSFGVSLYYAKKSGIVACIKIPPAKAGYYCNPKWLDENGELLPEYKIDPFWDLNKKDEHKD